jgi:purine-binding chemotaxis protein CheW
MSDDGVPIADRAARLRDAFDRSFAEPRAADARLGEDLLAIRIAAEPHALRLSEIAGVFADRRITPLPGGFPALLGIAGFRGAIVPVYDLPALLGHRPGAALRWLAMAAAAPVAFAFAVLDGHLRVAPDAIIGHDDGEHQRRHVRFFARTAGLVRPIIHLPSVLDAIRGQLRTNLHAGES